MKELRKLLNLIQLDLAEKLGLVRLKWNYTSINDQYTHVCIYGNSTTSNLNRLLVVFSNLLRSRRYNYHILTNRNEILVINVTNIAMITFELSKNGYITHKISNV